MSSPDGFDHLGDRAADGASDMRLTKREAREQLIHELRDQLGPLTFTVTEYDEDDDSHGEGVVIAKLGGHEVDHYTFHDIPPWNERNAGADAC